MDLASIWTSTRDSFDVERYPAITHTADQVEVIAEDDYLVKAQLTIRGASRESRPEDPLPGSVDHTLVGGRRR